MNQAAELEGINDGDVMLPYARRCCMLLGDLYTRAVSNMLTLLGSQSLQMEYKRKWKRSDLQATLGQSVVTLAGIFIAIWRSPNVTS